MVLPNDEAGAGEQGRDTMSDSSIISLSRERNKRHPTRYSVAINHDEKGRWILVNNIAPDKKSRLGVAEDLEAAAKAIRGSYEV